MAVSKKARYYQSKIVSKKIDEDRKLRIYNGSFTIDDIKASAYDNKYAIIAMNVGLKIIPVLENNFIRLYIQNKEGMEDADTLLFNQVKKPLLIAKRVNQLYEYYYLKLYGPNSK